MKNSLTVIGSLIIHNKAQKDYIIRSLEKKGVSLDSMFLLEDNEKDFVFEIESLKWIAKNIFIATDMKNYTTVAKMCATMSEDSLVGKSEMLIPAKALSTPCGKAFAFEYSGMFISVFCVDCGEIKIINDTLRTRKKINILNLDLDSSKLLIEPLCESFDIELGFYEIIEGLNVSEILSFNSEHIDEFTNSVKHLLGDKVIIAEDLFAYTVDLLASRRESVTFAESCTGGLLSYEFVKIPGCSDVYGGGVVSYSNSIKNTWLRVNEETLSSKGAVSEECVDEMLDGVLTLSGADYALAISGVAGPSGGSVSKPVGTVYVGAKKRDGSANIKRYLFDGDRELIQQKSSYAALFALLEIIDRTV